MDPIVDNRATKEIDGKPIWFTISYSADNIGIKESDDKLDYSEIDWSFVDGIAKRMNANKLKYPKNNFKKEVPIDLLQQALLRHLRKILQPIPWDDETMEEHLYAIGCNAMMLVTQVHRVKSN